MKVIFLLSGIFCGGMAVFYLIQYLLRDTEKSLLAIEQDREKMLEASFFLRLFVRAVPYIWRLHPEKRLSHSLSSIQERLNKAGNPLNLYPDEFFVLREFSAFGLFIAMMIVLPRTGFLISALLLGFFLPEIYLRDKRLRREKDFIKGFSFALDLLAITVEAGLDFSNALKRVVEKSPTGVAKSELEMILRGIMTGDTKSSALKKFGERWELIEVKSFVRSVIQSETLGTSISQSLKAQSEVLRQKRFQRAEKLAMEAPVKMLLPLLFIFASVFVFLFGPIIIDIIRGGFI